MTPSTATISSVARRFCGPLPENCPPETALEVVEMSVLRLVSSIEPPSDAFVSYAGLGKKRLPNTCECQFASCSVFKCESEKETYRFEALTSLPKFKHMPFVAKVVLSHNSGRYKNGHNGHIDLWIYDDIDIFSCIREVRKIVR